MTTCDVLIVGGGPAGSSCARRLRDRGADVLVLDRREFPRDKTCAGWVTPPVVDVLQLDLEEYAQGRTLQPITGFRTGMIGGTDVFTPYEKTVSYGIRRCEFDHFLLQRCGARLQLGTPLNSLERGAGKGTWVVNGEIETPLIVGAGGHFCPVARRLGARTLDAAVVVTAQEAEFAPDSQQMQGCGAEPEVPELYFCTDLKGYGWCFRKGNYLNIGLGRTESHQLSEHVAAFCEFLRQRGTYRGEISHRFHGHAYQLYERVAPRLVDDGVLLIGDSAGLAYPQSGEGIRPAVESGLTAADAIHEAGGDFSVDRLRPYAERIRARFGAPRTASSSWLPASWLQYLAAQLLSTQTFARHVVIDRWFLHTHQSALALAPASSN